MSTTYIDFKPVNCNVLLLFWFRFYWHNKVHLKEVIGCIFGAYCNVLCKSIGLSQTINLIRVYLMCWLKDRGARGYVRLRRYFITRLIPGMISKRAYSSGGWQRSSVAHRADNRFFNNDTAVGKQGARGNILLFHDASSTLHSKYE